MVVEYVLQHFVFPARFFTHTHTHTHTHRWETLLAVVEYVLELLSLTSSESNARLFAFRDAGGCGGGSGHGRESTGVAIK